MESTRTTVGIMKEQSTQTIYFIVIFRGKQNKSHSITCSLDWINILHQVSSIIMWTK